MTTDAAEAPGLVTHRPFGLEHPYAASPDQRVPAVPLVGQDVRLGVTAAGEVVSVTCLWERTGPDGASVDELTMAVGNVAAADTAALAGGEGHLADAQAAALGDSGGWVVQPPTLEANCSYRYRFRATTDRGRTQDGPWFDLEPAFWTGQPLGAVDGAGARLVPGSVEWLVAGNRAVRARFALTLPDGAHVAGFGERFDALDQAGRRLDAVVFEQYKSQAAYGRTYLPMPFAHVIAPDGAGWGFHVRTTRRTWYDVGATAADRLVVEVDLGVDGPPAVAVSMYDGSPTEVLSAFLDEAGRATELPEWVLRLWASGNEWNTQELVMRELDRHRDEDVPVGVVVIEAWSDEEGITVFRDAQYDVTEDGSAHTGADYQYPAGGAWPDPAGMVAELHSRGVKVVLWQIPLHKTDHGLGAQATADGEAMVREGHAVLESDGSAYRNRGWWFPQALMADLTVQRSRDWWTEKRRYLVRDLDVDGFKTDGGEHAWGRDLRYGDGRRGDEGNNLYPVHYARAFGDLLRSEGKAPVTFSRAGFTGSQAHGIVWAGDEDSTWEAFRASLTAGLTAASCGLVYWGWDLAGFSGPVPEPELYLRAAAASVFVPVMQYHSEFNHHRAPARDRTPWHVAAMHGDDSVVPAFRVLAHRRERLVPYLAEQARVAVRTDRPLMRPLFFDHPDDMRVWDHPLQWMLGDDLLVAPVTQPGRSSWDVYLPAGGWVDIRSGVEVGGGRAVSVEVPEAVDVPVWCRADRWTDRATLFA